jgi:hypothetical protein
MGAPAGSLCTTKAFEFMPDIFIYQILYTKPEDLDPGFLVLDNSRERAARLVRILAH